jgi:hypothetical protein
MVGLSLQAAPEAGGHGREQPGKIQDEVILEERGERKIRVSQLTGQAISMLQGQSDRVSFL